MYKRVVIIGCGSIAAAHASAIKELGPEQCQIVGLVDVDVTRANQFRLEYAPQARHFTEASELWEQCEVDAAIICTPPATHSDLATLCLEHDVAVLCEKPLTIDLAQARALIKLAHKRRTALRTSAKYRFVESVIATKRLIQSGALGEIHTVEIAFGAPFTVTGNWRLDSLISGGGVLMDNGTHAIDLAHYLLGEVQLKTAKLLDTSNCGVEDEAFLECVAATGATISMSLSWRRTLGPSFLKINAEKGVVDVGWESAVWRLNDNSIQPIGPAYNKGRAFRAQFASFLETITPQGTANRENHWPVEAGLTALELVMAAYSQHEI